MKQIANCGNKKDKTNPKLEKIYKYLKENIIIENEQNKIFLEKSLIFSIPIFHKVLFLFTLVKTILSTAYFIFKEQTYFNFNMSLILIQLTIAFLLTRQRNKLLEINGILKYSFIFFYCLEENMTLYYYDHLMYNMHPGFILFLMFLIVFYDLPTTTKFNEFAFYLYILNVVFLIFFLSIKNIMNFFLPFNLVLIMFILLNLMSQNYLKKMIKMKNFHQFFENLVDIIFKLNKDDLFVIYNNKIIYSEEDEEERFYEIEQTNKKNNMIAESSKDKKYLNKDSTELSVINSEYSFIKTKSDEDLSFIPIKDFKGFEIAYRNPNFDLSKDVANYEYNENPILFFTNILMYLQNPIKRKETENFTENLLVSESNLSNLKKKKKFDYELNKIYLISKNALKKSKLKNLTEKGLEEYDFSIRDKIITLMILFAFEPSNVSNFESNANYDELITNILINRNTIELSLDKTVVDKKENITNKLFNFIEKLSSFLNFNFKYEIEQCKILINFETEANEKFGLEIDNNYSNDNYYNLNTNVSAASEKSNSIKNINLPSEKEITLDNQKS